MSDSSKLYYTITEVAEMFGVEEHTLRYWEKEFPLLRPERDTRNRRKYGADDLAYIKKILYQKQDQGRTNKGAREHLTHREKAKIAVERLLRVRAFLIELKESLDARIN